MDGESICKTIHDWIECQYPEPWDWQSEEFHCLKDAPFELRFVLFHDAVECEISNGGLPQLLWNCFGTRRTVLDVAQQGYRLIGASEQADAIGELQRLFAREEPECRRYMRRAEGDFTWFGRWCGDEDSRMPEHVEKLFFESSGIYQKRLGWLERNEARILGLMGV